MVTETLPPKPDIARVRREGGVIRESHGTRAFRAANVICLLLVCAVTLYPFVAMDVPAGSGLPDPWTGAASQPPYPWRGRITCTPAPGRAGSPDVTGAIAASVARFFGAAAPGHFAWTGMTMAYSGPAEWSFRRHILHCAALARQAGGVDAFIVGSELVGITRLRSAPGAYPAAPYSSSRR